MRSSCGTHGDGLEVGDCHGGRGCAPDGTRCGGDAGASRGYAVDQSGAANVKLDVSDDAHVTDRVTVFVLPSLYVPVATICCVFPAVIEGVAGVTVREVSVGLTMKPLQPANAKVRTEARRDSDSNRGLSPMSCRFLSSSSLYCAPQG